MNRSPIQDTLSDLMNRLAAAVEQHATLEAQIAEYASAIKALAQVCEDAEMKDHYLEAVDNMTGKPSFVDSIRSMLRLKPDGLTPTELRAMIQLQGKMNLSSYSNPLASIHTTLRRMKESDPPEVEEFQKNGEKAYRLVKRGIQPPSTIQSVRKRRII